MENVRNMKAALVAAFTAIGALLGWKGILGLIWVIAMSLDYLSGTIAAIVRHDWSSKVAREGLMHKGGMIFVVLVAGISDLGMSVAIENMEIGFQWPGAILPLVFVWYIVTELGSILENAVTMGATAPSWLISLLRASANVMDKVGDKGVEQIQSKAETD